MDTMKALMEAHTVERRVFARMVDMDMEVSLAKRTMAYWMYLESLGCKDFLRKLSSHDDKFLSLVCTEAKFVLENLQQLISDSPILSTTTTCTSPITFNLIANPSFSLYESIEERECVSRGVTDLYDGVCSMVFEDIMEERGKMGKEKGKEIEVTLCNNVSKLNPFAKEWLRNVVSRTGNETSPGGAAVCGGAKTAADGGSDSKIGGGGGGGGSGWKLNPNAKEWHPKMDEESRSLYITFSNGFPISKNQIYNFFTLRYGPYVENIDIHQPRDGVPLFGKITFKISLVPVLILNGGDKVKFFIEGKTIWCKKYIPKIRYA